MSYFIYDPILEMAIAHYKVENIKDELQRLDPQNLSAPNKKEELTKELKLAEEDFKLTLENFKLAKEDLRKAICEDFG